ncbi:hypothetical protein [Dokdonia sp. Asnod1-B02]|uniref:hypothetical protein n=1 Tax=Dokdonia sp. Asnod1-B02 TaxID=3160573 RepID=UPI00386EEA5F
MNKDYFHISRIENKDSIIKNGLNATDGKIFLFDNILQSRNIAFNQLFIDEYSFFRVSSKGFKSKVKEDNVAELGTEHQFYLEQENIAPEYIEFSSDQKFNIYDYLEEVDYPRYKNLGYSDEQYIGIISLDKGRIERYNEVNGTNHPYTGN